MVKAVARIAALDVEAERLAVAVGAADVGVDRRSALVPPYKDGVVVLRILVEQPVMREGRSDAAVDPAGLGEVRENPPHVRICFGQREGLGFRLGRRGGLEVPAKERLHGFRKAHAVVFLQKADSVPAAPGCVVVPLAAAYCDAVVVGKALFSAGADQLLPAALEKGFQIRRGGAFFLLLGEGNVWGDGNHLGS